MIRKSAAAIRAQFIEQFAHQPQVIARAPGRVNLIGEHTDYNDGVVLPIAIDKAVHVAIAPTPDGRPGSIVLADIDRTTTFEDAADLPPAHLVALIAGQILKAPSHALPWNVFAGGDLPIGAGLSSSAALGCAAALAFDHACATGSDRADLARLVQSAEHEALGTQCGMMDMFASLHCRKDHAILLDCRTLAYDHIELPPADTAALLVVNTGVMHELATSAYADRRRVCHEAAATMGLASLRDATLGMLEHEALSAEQRQRASHVITENTRVLLCASAFRQGDLRTAGDLMFASHESLRSIFEVSCDELDFIVDAALALREQGIVYGARMTGGGFGGCAIILARSDSAQHVAAVIRDGFTDRFARQPGICCTEPCDAGRAFDGSAQSESSRS